MASLYNQVWDMVWDTVEVLLWECMGLEHACANKPRGIDLWDNVLWDYLGTSCWYVG